MKPNWFEVAQTSIRHREGREVYKDSDGNTFRVSYKPEAAYAAMQAAKLSRTEAEAFGAVIKTLEAHKFLVLEGQLRTS